MRRRSLSILRGDSTVDILEISESIVNQIELIALVLLVALVIRLVVVRFISSLVNRGTISISIKAILVRIIDLILISAVLIVIVNIVTASLTPYAIVVVFGLVALAFFYQEIKQFTAFIALQMFKHVKGRYVEVYIPGFQSPISGRVVELAPLTSVIEDLFGNKIYIPNTLLTSSAIKEYNPSIIIRLVLHINSDTDMDNVFNDVKSAFKNVDLGPFRFNESYLIIRSLDSKVDSKSLTIDVRLSALSLPLRNPDLLRILNQLSKTLSKYEPMLGIV